MDPMDLQWINWRENLSRKPWFYMSLLLLQGVLFHPFSMFPSSSSKRRGLPVKATIKRNPLPSWLGWKIRSGWISVGYSLVVYLPLWKILISWDDDIPNIWKNKSHVPNHQPGYQYDTKCDSLYTDHLAIFAPWLEKSTIYSWCSYWSTIWLFDIAMV